MTLIDAAVVVVAGEDSEDDDIDSFMMTLLTAWDGVLQVGLGSLRALSRASFGCNGSVSQPSQRLYDDGSAAGRSTPAGFRSIPEFVCVCVCVCVRAMTLTHSDLACSATAMRFHFVHSRV